MVDDPAQHLVPPHLIGFGQKALPAALLGGLSQVVEEAAHPPLLERVRDAQDKLRCKTR